MEEKVTEPFFRPFIGVDYWQPTRFSKRLLVVGESHYLEKPQDNHPDFVPDLLKSVVNKRLMRGWRTPYYSNVFYLLVGKRGRDVEQSEWEAVWQSLAFYNFVQTDRLTRPLERPTKSEWRNSFVPFKSVLAKLRPERVILTGRMLTAYAARGALTRPDTVGVWLQTVPNEYAFTRCVYHPSSRQSIALREKQRQLVWEMFQKDWPLSAS